MSFCTVPLSLRVADPLRRATCYSASRMAALALLVIDVEIFSD
jgi:hypothetical protein